MVELNNYDTSYLKYGDKIVLFVETVQGFVSSQGFANPNLFVQKSNFGSEIFTRNFRDFVFTVCPKLNYDARKDYNQASRFYQKSAHSGGNAGNEGGKKGEKEAKGKSMGGNKDPQANSINNQQKKNSNGLEEQTFKKKMQQLQKKLLEEEEINVKILDRRMGEIVTYGQEIQLLHCDSETFITAKKMCADVDKSCNKVELSDHGSSSIYFKVMPRYKYRQEGEKILYNDQVVLQNQKLNLYLHITEQLLHPEKPLELPKVGEEGQTQITPHDNDSRAPANQYCPTYELNISTQLSRFQIQPFANFDQQDKQTIRGGCVIKLQHSELQGYLASDDKDFTDDGMAEVFLWIFKGKLLDVENFNTSSLFEIEIANQDKDRGQNCMESDPPPDPKESKDRDKESSNKDSSSKDGKEGVKEEKEEEGMLYRIRHLNTGRLVCAQEITFEGQKVMTLGLCKHLDLRKQTRDPNQSFSKHKFQEYIIDNQDQMKQDDQNTLFRITSTNSEEDKTLKNNICVKIQHVSTGLYLSVRKKSIFLPGRNNMAKQKSNESSSDIGTRMRTEEDQSVHGDIGMGNQLYQAIEDEEITQAYRHVIELKQIAGHTDAFFIQLESEEALKDILYIHTALGIIKQSIPYLCIKDREIPKEIYLQFERILINLNRFVRGKDEGNENKEQRQDHASTQVQFNQGSEEDLSTLRQRIVKRQKIVRELYLIELIVQILYYPFATGAHNLDDITVNDQITKICTLAYVLLKNAVGGYEINEMYASQWINLFFMQAMKTKNTNDIHAQTTVNELVSDNRKLLEVQINPKIIQQFISLCKSQEKHKRLIKLLTALCSCNGDPIVHNQNDVVKYLLLDIETRDALMMPIRIKDNVVDVQLQHNQYIPLSTLQDVSKSKDEGRIYKYFLSIVELAADLVQGRNQKASQSLSTIFNIDASMKIIYDNKLPFDMRSYFIELFLNMYMDREPLEPLQIPSMTVIQTDIPILKDLITSNEKGYTIQQSKCVIPPQLQQYKDYVLNYLKNENGVQSVFEKKKNQFIFWVLKSLFFMLSHGFYKNQKELNQLSLPLILLLDGSNDIYTDASDPNSNEKSATMERYKFSKENEIILKSKKIQCDCLIFISQMELDGRGDLFLAKLKYDYEMQKKQQQDGGHLGKALMGRLFRKQTIPGLDKKASQPLVDKRESQNLGEGLDFMSRLRAAYNSGDPKDIDLLLQQTSNVDFLNEVASLRGFEEEIEDVYICMLFDLLLYKYPELNQTAFELLVRYFTRRRTMLECLNNVQILESKHSIEVLNKVKIYQSELKLYIQEAEEWMNKKEKNATHARCRVKEIFKYITHFCVNNNGVTLHSGRKPRKQLAKWLIDKSQSNLLSGLISSSTIMKETAEDEQDAEDKQLEENEEFIMFLEFKNQENRENQRIMRNFQVQESAIYFISFRMELNASQNQDYINLIKQCYRFLIRFVRQNPANQSALRDNLDVFLKDIDKFTLAPLLIYEIFRDNKRLLNLNVSKILKQIVAASEDADINSSRKATLMKLLNVFCRFKDKLVRQNQQDIIIFMTNNVVRSSILYLFSNEGFTDISNLLNTCKDIEILENFVNNQYVSGPTMIVTNPIFNIMNCIELLSTCCEGKSDMAELKCQTDVLPLENAFRILEACEYFWPLKTQLINYMTQCFLDSTNKNVLAEDDEIGLKNLWKSAEVVVNDLINIVENTQNEDEVFVRYPNKELITLKKLSFQFLGSALIPFFKALLKKKSLNIQAHEKLLAAMAKYIAKLYYICAEYPEVKRQAYFLIKFIHESSRFSRYIDSIKHPFAGQAEHNTIENEDEENSKTKHEIIESSKSTTLSSKILQLQQNKDIKDQIEKEFEQLVLWVTHIEKKIRQVTKNQNKQGQNYNISSFQNLNFSSVVCAILNLIDSKTLTKDLHISGLRLIRKIVEVENQNLVTPASDWDTDEWVEFKSMIKMKQDALVDIGTIKFLCKHISEIDDDDILEQTLLAAIALLLGGNAKSQQAFLEYMSDNDPHNRVINKVKNMLSKHQKNKKTIENKIKKTLASAFIRKESHDIPDNEQSQENLMTLEDSFQVNADDKNGGEVLDTYADESSQVNQAKQQSINKMMRILRFLQLLTENHFTPMQEFLREQNTSSGQTNSKSVDLVSYISTLLGNYENQYVNCYSCNLGYQMIETLTEFVQGPCKENQRALVNAKVIDNCRDLISQGTQSERELKEKGFNDDKIKLLDGLKMKSVRLLLSIIEGPIDQEIIKNITVSLDDFEIIFERLNSVYTTFVTEELGLPENSSLSTIQGELGKDSFDGDIQEGFDIFILVNSLADCYPEAQKRIENFEENNYYQFFKHNTGQIEILVEAEQLQRVYFPLKPVCRTSPQQKILGLLKAVPDLIDEMEHVELLSRQTIQVTPDRLNFLRDCSTLLAVGISILIIGFYKYDSIIYSDGSIDIGPTIAVTPGSVIVILGYIQLGTAAILLVGWIINKASLIIKAGWRSYIEENRIKHQSALLKIKNNESGVFGIKKSKDMNLLDARMVLLTQGPDAQEFQNDGKLDLGHVILKLEYLWICASFVIGNGQFKFFIIYLSLSLLGLYQSPIFYSFQLLDIINRFATLRNVIQAITLNKNQLLMTAMLGLIIIYIYSVLAYAFFFDMFYNEDINLEEWIGEKGDMTCQTLFHCYISTINYGLRAGGGIGEALPALSFFNSTQEEYFIRVVFDLSFFLIVIIMFLNIIFGIIIDTFAELRENKRFVDDDMKNTCFICNIDRQTFDRDTENGFMYHILNEHNLWMYVFFIIHLKTKDKTDYNGTESFISDKLIEEDISWFPLHTSIALEKEKYVISENSGKQQVIQKSSEKDDQEPEK
eukprot:403332539